MVIEVAEWDKYLGAEGIDGSGACRKVRALLSKDGSTYEEGQSPYGQKEQSNDCLH